jgi:hypothetical protein
VPVTPPVLRAALLRTGMSDLVADLLVAADVAKARGKLRPASTGVAELTGLLPLSVAEFMSPRRHLLLDPRARLPRNGGSRSCRIA